MSKKIFIIILPFLLFTVFCKSKQNDVLEEAVINAENVNMREKADINSKVIALLQKGTVIEILEAIDTKHSTFSVWAKGRVKNQTIVGYIYSQYLSIEQYAKAKILAEKYYEVKILNHEIIIINKQDNNIVIKYKLNSSFENLKIQSHFYDPFLTIELFSDRNLYPIFAGVINIQTTIWHYKFKEFDIYPLLPNLYPISLSPSKKYIVYDVGTTGGYRMLVFVDLKLSKIINRVEYYESGDKRPYWEKDDKFIYYKADKSSDLFPSKSFSKFYWKDGIENKIKMIN